MKLKLETLSHKSLEFYQQLPMRFAGALLPGGEILSASGAFGDLCIQEFDGGNFLIRYSVLQTREPFELQAKSYHSGLHAVIMLKNEVNPVFENTNLKIGEQQFTILQAHEPGARLNFQGRQQYICFEALLSDSLSTSLLSDFPEAPLKAGPPSALPDIWVNPAEEMNDEVREHIRYIFTYSDLPKWRRSYFENRVWDIAWKLLAVHLSETDEKDDPSKESREKAYAVQRLILDNLDEHELIRDLAQKVTLSQSGLKKIFSKVFGMGIHEYRIYERLKKAIQLIEQGMSVKEAAAETGWRSADLGRAYFKVYGTTPGTIKKKK